MQVLGIVGSMRKKKHTNTLVNQVINDMKLTDSNIVADIIYIADKTIHPCKVVCSNYCSKNSFQCSISDDATEILHLMMKADALIIGAPLYFRAPPARFQALIERLISIFFFNETQGEGSRDSKSPLYGKPCGLIGVAEYSNPYQILEYLHDFCMVLKMKPVALEKFPYLGIAGQGDVNQDKIFRPFERAKDLADTIVKEVKRREKRIFT
ncbi:MAG: flavodoxin family protein [Candidatus Hodarchaeota archaeon]